MPAMELGEYLRSQQQEYHACIEACVACWIACEMCSAAHPDRTVAQLGEKRHDDKPPIGKLSAGPGQSMVNWPH